MNIKLQTWAEGGKDRIFIVNSSYIKKVLPDIGFKDLRTFKSEYTFCDSEILYNLAKENGKVIHEYLIDTELTDIEIFK